MTVINMLYIKIMSYILNKYHTILYKKIHYKYLIVLKYDNHNKS